MKSYLHILCNQNLISWNQTLTWNKEPENFEEKDRFKNEWTNSTAETFSNDLRRLWKAEGLETSITCHIRIPALRKSQKGVTGRNVSSLKTHPQCVKSRLAFPHHSLSAECFQLRTWWKSSACAGNEQGVNKFLKLEMCSVALAVLPLLAPPERCESYLPSPCRYFWYLQHLKGHEAPTAPQPGP